MAANGCFRDSTAFTETRCSNSCWIIPNAISTISSSTVLDVVVDVFSYSSFGSNTIWSMTYTTWVWNNCMRCIDVVSDVIKARKKNNVRFRTFSGGSVDCLAEFGSSVFVSAPPTNPIRNISLACSNWQNILSAKSYDRTIALIA